jgi:hypothetical protein
MSDDTAASIVPKASSCGRFSDHCVCVWSDHDSCRRNRYLVCVCVCVCVRARARST